jgi:hypothetical protein
MKYDVLFSDHFQLRSEYNQSCSHPDDYAFSSDATPIRTTLEVASDLDALDLQAHTSVHFQGRCLHLRRSTKLHPYTYNVYLDIMRRHRAPETERVRNADDYVAQTYEL